MSISLYLILEMKKKGLEEKYAELNAIYKKQWIKRWFIKEKLADLKGQINMIDEIMLILKDNGDD